MIGTKEEWAVVPIAEAIARRAHHNMLRKFKNVDYITHPEAVVDMVRHPNAKVVAWIHDVLEDNPNWTAQRLIEEGIPADLVAVVEVLTKRKGESYYGYIMRILNDPLATSVKIADITHNLSDLDPLSHQSLRDKYLLARHILTVRI